VNAGSPGAGRWIGYAEAVAAACLWGSSGIFAVYLFRMGVPPESLALLRPLVGAVLLLAVSGVARPKSLRVDGSGLVILTVGGGMAVGLFQLAYQLSTDAVGVPTTVALLYLAPAIVLAASGPLLGEWPTRTRAGLAAITLLGVWLSVAGAEDVTTSFGAAGLTWGVIAGCSYAAYTLFGRYAVPRFGAIPTVVYSTLGATALLAIALPVISGPVEIPTSTAVWGLIFVFGALTIALAQFLFFDALGRVEASRASLATAVEPVVAAVLATCMLGQGLRPIGWLGIALVVGGVVGVGVTATVDPTEAEATES
jgi:drug/metabolite transporter, DME family